MDNTQMPMDQPEPPAVPEVKPAPHPRSVSLLLLGVLIITVINLTRFILSLRDWSFLVSRATVSPLYLAMSGLVWTVAGSVLTWGLWRAKNWAPRLMQAVALTYALYYWLDLVFLRDHPVSGPGSVIGIILPTNWPFSAGVTVLSLVYIVWTLGRPNVKAFFGQAEDESALDHSAGNEETDI